MRNVQETHGFSHGLLTGGFRHNYTGNWCRVAMPQVCL